MTLVFIVGRESQDVTIKTVVAEGTSKTTAPSATSTRPSSVPTRMFLMSTGCGPVRAIRRCCYGKNNPMRRLSSREHTNL